jgi:Family of unknown function (DUF6311)
MGTQATSPPAESPQTQAASAEAVRSRSRISLDGPLWFDLAIAVIAGLVYTLIVMGPAPLNPRDVDWVTVDPAYHYVGWELWRQDPHVHWPLTYTDRLGYPRGESIAWWT